MRDETNPKRKSPPFAKSAKGRPPKFVSEIKGAPPANTTLAKPMVGHMASDLTDSHSHLTQH